MYRALVAFLIQIPILSYLKAPRAYVKWLSDSSGYGILPQASHLMLMT